MKCSLKFLSSCSPPKAEDNKVQGLDAGARWLYRQAIFHRELVSRIKAVLRRSSALSGEKTHWCGRLVARPTSQRVSANNKAVDIGPTEYRLLAFFMRSSRAGLYSHPATRSSVGWQCIVCRKIVPLTCISAACVKCLSHLGFADYIQTVRGTGIAFLIKSTNNSLIRACPYLDNEAKID